jgi:tetratricopeptide (TPR) repeat protein
MQTLFTSSVKSKSAVRRMAPWAALGLGISSLLLLNLSLPDGLPIQAGPPLQSQHTSVRNGLAQTVSQVLTPHLGVIQLTYVYNSRNPDQLFGNFYYTLGTQLAARGQLIPAEETLAKAIHLLPNDAYGHMNYAIVLEALQKYPEASAEYLKATQINPQLVQAWYSLGLLQDKMGNTPLGIQTLCHAIELAPNNGFINYDLGVLYAKQSDYRNSAIYSKKAVENGGDFAEAYNNYGYALAQLGQYAEAVKMVDKSLALKPDSAAALDSKGFALSGMGKPQDALTAYLDALRQDPTIGEIYLHIAQTYEKLQNNSKALKSYQTYLQMTPDAPDKAAVEARIKQLGNPAENKTSETKAGQTKAGEAKK